MALKDWEGQLEGGKERKVGKGEEVGSQPLSWRGKKGGGVDKGKKIGH